MAEVERRHHLNCFWNQRYSSAGREEDEAVEDEEEDQQMRLEVPRLVPRQVMTIGDGRQQQQQQQQQQKEKNTEEEEEERRRQEHQHHRDGGGCGGGGGGGGGGGAHGGGGGGPGGVGPTREGDLDVMSATSTALGHVHPSIIPPATTVSQRQRRAQIESCWCNIPELCVDPASRAAYYWMALVTVAVVYNWIVVIMRVAFEDMRESGTYQRAFCVLDTLCDVLYLMDVAIQSRTAYLVDGCLVRSLPETVRHYRSQPYFAMDVLSVVPVTTVLHSLTRIGFPIPFESGVDCIATPALRILRLLKYPSMTRFFEKTDSRTNNPNLLRAFRLSLHLWLVIHWIGCFYYLLSQYEGLGTNDWVYPSTSEFADFRRKYIVCMYWSTMTLTTIGERPGPATDVEYIFTGLTFLIGVFVFAAVVGNVGDVISNMNAARHDFQARMDQIKFYLNHRNVPEHLQDQIKRWAEYTWARTKAINEHSVLQLLPSRLRTEVAIHVHLNTLKKVRIFEQCEEGLLRELVTKLRPSIYSPGEYICRLGEIGREMYIIDHGKVEILFPEHGSGQMKQVAVMTPGNYFGEISLLKLDDGQNKRTADVRSIGFSELLCLSRRDLMSALMEYPEAKKILEAQARQRMQQTKRVPHDSDSAESPSVVVHPSSSELSGSAGGGGGAGAMGFKPGGRRSARAVFAQVMRQEGFSRLLESTANEELMEMRSILRELKEIKKTLYEAKRIHHEQQDWDDEEEEEEQQRGRKLQEIRTRLLRQTNTLATLSGHASTSASLPPNPAALSSDASTLTSPSIAHGGTHTSPIIYANGSAPGMKTSPDCHGLPALAMKPSSPQNRHASSDRNVLCVDAMPDQTELSAQVVRDMSAFGVTSAPPQPQLRAGSLVPATSSSPERVSRRRRSPSSRTPRTKEKDQQENVDRLAESGSGLAPFVPGVQGGGGDDPTMPTVDKVPSVKDVHEETETANAQMSTSSVDSCKESLFVDTSLESAVGSNSGLESSVPSSVTSLERQLGSRAMAVRVSSEQLGSVDSLKNLASSSDDTSSSYHSTTTNSSGGRGNSPKPAKPKPKYPERSKTPEHSSQDVTIKKWQSGNESQPCSDVVVHSAGTEDTNVEQYCSDGIPVCSSHTVSSDSVNSSERKESSHSFFTCPSEAENKCATVQCFVHKHTSQRMNTGNKNEECLVKTIANVGLEESYVYCDTDDSDNKFGLIAATRVKSDFDKRIPQEYLPRSVTCKKIDDIELSILLAKRREVNDSDHTIESPDRPSLQPVHGNCATPEHSHSVQSVITTTIHGEGDFPQISPKDLATCVQKIEDDNDTMNTSFVSEEHKVSTALEDSSSISGKGARVDTDSGSQHSNQVYKDIVYVENLGSETTDCINSKESLKASQDDVGENDESAKVSNRQSCQTVEEKDQVEKEESEQSITAAGSQVNNETTSETYPASILKKPQSETQSADMYASSDTDHQSNTSSTENAVSSTVTHVDDIHDPPMSLEDNNHPHTDVPVEHCTSLSENTENGEKDGDAKSDGEKSSLEKVMSDRLEHHELPSETSLERISNDLSDLKSKDCLNHGDTELPDDKRLPSEPFSGYESAEERNLTRIETLSEVNLQQFKEDIGNEALPSRYHQWCSDSQHDSQNPEKIEKLSEAEGPCTDPLDSKSCAVTEESSWVSISWPSDSVSNSQDSLARKHSEKLDSLIDTVGSAVDQDERDDSADSLPKLQITSQASTDNNDAELAQNNEVNDTGGNDTSSMNTVFTATLDRQDERESENTSPFMPCLPAGRQTHKMLRRRGSTKHNPYERKESPQKSSAHDHDDSTDAVPSEFKLESPKGKTLPLQEPKDFTVACIPLVQSLIWEVDSNKQQSTTSCDEDQSVTQPCATSGNGLSGTFLLEPEPRVRPDEMEPEQGPSFDRSTSSPSIQKSVSGSSRIVSGSDPVTSRIEIASLSKDMSFKDKFKEAAGRFKCEETLDRDNNSAVACSHNTFSSGGSSPSECVITKSMCPSHLHMKPLNLCRPLSPILRSDTLQGTEETFQRNTESNVDTLAEHDVGFLGHIEQVGLRPSDPQLVSPLSSPGDVAQEENELFSHQDTHHHQCQPQNEPSEESNENTTSDHIPVLPENIADVDSTTQTLLPYHASLLDSPGASSMDDSSAAGAEKDLDDADAEVVDPFILLADFGVEDEEDEEGALSGLSGCEDGHSDFNSDLDDL